MANKTNYTKNGNKYYRVTRVVGHKADGTPIRKEFYGKGINEANEKANEYMNKIKNGYSIDFDKVTVADLLKKWLFNIKLMELKPSSFASYEICYRKYILVSPLAGMKLKEVKKMTIQEYYNSLFKDGKTTQKIKAIHKLLHSFFEFAIDEGYIIKNPCHKIVIPKDVTKKQNNDTIDIFTQDEINSIKNAFKNNKYETLIYTAIYTGMRERRNCCFKMG